MSEHPSTRDTTQYSVQSAEQIAHRGIEGSRNEEEKDVGMTSQGGSEARPSHSRKSSAKEIIDHGTTDGRTSQSEDPTLDKKGSRMKAMTSSSRGPSISKKGFYIWYGPKGRRAKSAFASISSATHDLYTHGRRNTDHVEGIFAVEKNAPSTDAPSTVKHVECDKITQGDVRWWTRTKSAHMGTLSWNMQKRGDSSEVKHWLPKGSDKGAKVYSTTFVAKPDALSGHTIFD